MKRVLIFILIVFLPLFLLLKSVEINTFDKEFYIDSYEKYGVLKVTGKTIQELEDITDDLLSYLKGKADEKILEKNFNSREILHMIDVKVLFDYGYMLKNISLILILLSIGLLCYFKDYVSLGKTLFYGPFIWWGAILILFLLSLSDFNRYFTYFHLIFFDNDLWLLNPETDLLIQMLPLEFFISIFKKIVLLFLLLMAIIQIIGYVVMRKGKDWSEELK